MLTARRDWLALGKEDPELKGLINLSGSFVFR